MRRPSRLLLILLAVVASPSLQAVFAQEPASQPAPGSSTSKPTSGSGGTRHSDDFLVRGTVFTAEGLALPGAELRIRRSVDKKPHWETATNSRGDFAIRVKMGADYEVNVRAKGFQEQSLSVDAKTGERSKDLVFRLRRVEAK